MDVVATPTSVPATNRARLRMLLSSLLLRLFTHDGWRLMHQQRLFRLDVRGLDDRPPLRGLSLVPGSKRLGRKLIALRDFEAKINKTLLHRRIGERLDHGGVELVHSLLRRPLRHPEAIPQCHVETRQARLIYSRNIGRS